MAVVSPLRKYKLVFLGDQKVGKTSIITRFMYDKFDPVYQATIGIDFLSKTMYLEDITVRLQLWDTSGQMRFRSLIPSYIKDSSAAVIVYGITNRESFLNVSKWIEQVRMQRGNNVIIVLVGNNNDRVERQVSLAEGDKKAREHGVMFMETSTKANFNIKRLFQWIAVALPKMETLSSTIHEGLVDNSSTNDHETRKAEVIPDIAQLVVDFTDHGIPNASHQTAPAQTTDTLSSIPVSVSFAHPSSWSSESIMTIEELQRLGPWMVESMTLVASTLRVQLPPFHYGKTSSVSPDIPSTSSTHHNDDDASRSEPDATTIPQTDQ